MSPTPQNEPDGFERRLDQLIKTYRVHSSDPDDEGLLFSQVRFCILAPVHKSVQFCLIRYGATFNGPYLNEQVTHVICDCPEKERLLIASNIFKIPPVVTSDWVRYSLRCQIILPVRPFSINHGADWTLKIFSGSVFGFVGVSHSNYAAVAMDDELKLRCMIVYYGGKCSNDLGRCNLVVGAAAALVEEVGRRETEVVVTPEFVVECIKQKKIVDTRLYRPELVVVEAPSAGKKERSVVLRDSGRMEGVCRTCPPNSSTDFEPVCGFMFLTGFVFHFEEDVEVIRGRRLVIGLAESIRNRGGTVFAGLSELKDDFYHIIVTETQRSRGFGRFFHDFVYCKLVTSAFVEDCLSEHCIRSPWRLYHLPSFHSRLLPLELPLRKHVVFLLDEQQIAADHCDEIRRLIRMMGGEIADELNEFVSMVVVGSTSPAVKVDGTTVMMVGVDRVVGMYFGGKNHAGSPPHLLKTAAINHSSLRFMLSPWKSKKLDLDAYDLFDPPVRRQRILNTSRCLAEQSIPDNVPNVIGFHGFSIDEEQRLVSLTLYLAFRESEHGNRRFHVTRNASTRITHLVCKDFCCFLNGFGSGTKKLLVHLACCSQQQRYVLNTQWIEDSLKKGHFVPVNHSDHDLNRDVFSFVHGLDIDAALNRTRPVFENMLFSSTTITTPSDYVKQIVEAGGGHFERLWTILRNSERRPFILISCEKDIDAIFGRRIPENLNVQSVSFLVSSLFSDKPPDFDSHRIRRHSALENVQQRNDQKA